MPLEICFVPKDLPEEEEHNIVLPGEVAIFSDYSTGEQEEVGIFCETDDSCGKVIILDVEVGTDDGEGVADYTHSGPATLISPGEVVEREVRVEGGVRGTLVMRHLAYSAINHAKYVSPN